MIQNIINLFKSDITVIENNKQDTDILKKIVKLYSKGNVNLQKGKYITSDRVHEIQKEVFEYKFSL